LPAPYEPGGRDPCLACHRRLLQRTDRGDEPAHQVGEARRARLPQLPQLPAAAAAPLRGGMADSPDRETTRPRTTFGDVEPNRQTRQCHEAPERMWAAARMSRRGWPAGAWRLESSRRPGLTSA
jgi:hypothetical protein